MTNNEIIRQLESLKDNSASFICKEDPDDIWTKDIEALDYAIALLKATDLPLSICVYCDSTDLYTEDEINRDNLTYLLFPRSIVTDWWRRTDPETPLPLWLREYTADDTDGLYAFAKANGFTATRPN